MTAPAALPASAYQLTAERLADFIAGHRGQDTSRQVTVLADEMTTGGTLGDLRATILAGRKEAPIVIGSGGLDAGMLPNGILTDAGPDVYEVLAARWMAQAMDALAGNWPDADLAEALLTNYRLAITLAALSRGVS